VTPSAAGVLVSDGVSGGVATGCNSKGSTPSVQVSKSTYTLATGLAFGQVTCTATTESGLADVTEMNLTVGGVLIHADYAQTQCVANLTAPQTPQVQVLIHNLDVNHVALPAAFSGSLANQVYTLPNGLGTIVTNEQTPSGSPSTVTAIAVHLASGLSFQFASVTQCGGTPPTRCCTLVGSAAGAVLVDPLTVASAPSCGTSSVVPSVSQHAANFTLSTGVAGAQVICSTHTVTGTANVSEVNLTIGSVKIHADYVEVQAVASCDNSKPHATALITGLTVNGVTQPAAYNGSLANQTLTLPNGMGTLTTNEQTLNGSALTVNGIHVKTTSGLDFIFATATVSASGTGVPCTPVPLAQQVADRRLLAA
jgi:hypothetical protein